MKKYILGIDFGHGETAAWVVPIYGQKTKLSVKGESLKLSNTNVIADRTIDSVIYQDVKGNYSLFPGGGYIITSMKGKISNVDEHPAYMAFILNIVNRALGLNSDILHKEDGEWNFYLCIACPTKWNNGDRQKYLEFFNMALRPLNIEVTWVINESDAAYFTHRADDKNVLVIDYGSSTIDYTVISQGRKVSKDYWSNDQLGASIIELAYLNKIYSQPGFEDTIDACVKACRQTGNIHMADEGKIRNELLYICRKLKEDAFTKGIYPQMPLSYFNIAERVGILDPDGTPFESLTFKFSNNLGEIIGPVNGDNELIERCYIWWVRESLRDLKDHIQKETDCKQIDSVILSGGASIMSWLKPIIQEIFGDFVNIANNIAVDTTPSFVVAKGIALYAQSQLQAFEKFMTSISELNLAEFYTMADEKATGMAVKNRIDQQVVQKIKSQNGMTGKQMRQLLCDFIEGLNPQDVAYCTDVKNSLNQMLSNTVAEHLSTIVKDTFGQNINKDDISITADAQILPFNHSEFEPGGSFYTCFTSIIKESASTFWEFNFENPRDNSVRAKIANGCATYLKKLADDDLNISYPDQFLSVQASHIREQVLKQAVDLFYKNQLFETTFKNVESV